MATYWLYKMKVEKGDAAVTLHV